MSVRARTVDARKRLSLGAAVAAVAVFAVTGAFGPADDSAGAAVARDRAVADMPDEISGPQVHFLYVVPSDGADGQLDTNGVMEQSIARIERWVEKQTGNQGLRVDTYNGVPDITFVRLPRSDAQAAATLYGPLWAMGDDLVAAGFKTSAKVYVALYDGPQHAGVRRREIAGPTEARRDVHQGMANERPAPL
jgi:hypothetical protein